MNGSRNVRFHQLAALARRETIPPIDVTGQVLRHLQTRTVEPSVDWVLAGAALFSVAAAMLVMALANQHGVLFNDTLAELIRPFTPVLQ